MMIFGAVILIFAGERIAGFFSRDSEVIIIAGSYLFMVAFLAFIYQLIDRCDSVLSGLRKPAVNVFYTFIRLVFLPPFVIYLFSETFEKGLIGIWWAIFFTNLLGSVFVYFHMRYIFKNQERLVKGSSPL